MKGRGCVLAKTNVPCGGRVLENKQGRTWGEGGQNSESWANVLFDCPLKMWGYFWIKTIFHRSFFEISFRITQVNFMIYIFFIIKSEFFRIKSDIRTTSYNDVIVLQYLYFLQHYLLKYNTCFIPEFQVIKWFNFLSHHCLLEKGSQRVFSIGRCCVRK